MKKHVARALALMMAIFGMVASGCNTEHQHNFNQKNEDAKYLRSEATCSEEAKYYYSCECGEAGEKVFSVGKKLVHDYTDKVMTADYLRKEGNCQTGAEYFYACKGCGKRSSKTFVSEVMGEHNYTEEVAEGYYLKEEATHTSSAVYYKSCACGLAGEETFTYGEPLRTYTDEEKVPYKPTSLTVTLYDLETGTYGFTYNTKNEPLRPVIQVAKGSTLTDYQEYAASVEKTTASGEVFYVVKAEVALEKNTQYTYRAYDKYVDIGTDTVVLQTKDWTADTFTFAHLSDSQDSNGLGTAFGTVLSSVVESSDFIVHTGDVVEDSRLESHWTNMLDGNFQYLSTIPMMTVTGNHEATYMSGVNEHYEHFHHNIPQQTSKAKGYYYSFTYGNAKFIMLNTNETNGLPTEQYEWLIGELENNTAAWTIVAMHNPMYSAGRYGSDSSSSYYPVTAGLQKQLKGVFAEYGVDIVLQGHDHVVSRTYPIDGTGKPTSETFETVNGVDYSVDPAGVLYVMSGPAGSQTRSPDAKMNASLYKYATSSKASSWSEFAIEGNRLTVTMKYGASGTVYHKWGVVKSV